MDKDDFDRLKEISKEIESIRLKNNLTKLYVKSDKGFITISTGELKTHIEAK